MTQPQTTPPNNHTTPSSFGFAHVYRFLGMDFSFYLGSPPDHASDLPQPIRKFIRKASAAGCLAARERAELADHFRSGLADGHTPEQLILCMGSARILGSTLQHTRAPVEWWVTRFFRWAGCLFLLSTLAYITLWASLRWASPQPTVDYYALLSQDALATPPQERAWPLYRQAFSDPRLSLNKSLEALQRPYFQDRPNDDDTLPRPGDPEWPKAAAYLKDIQPLLSQLRTAAGKPFLGLPLYRFNQLPPEDLAALQTGPSLASRPVADDPICRLAADAFDPDTSQISTVWVTFRILSADMHLAAEQGDATRFFADFEAQLSGARQLGQIPLFSTARYYTFRITERAIAYAAQVALMHPGFLSEVQIADLRLKSCQAVDALAALPILPDAPYLDRMQRIFTPGPSGRITRDGLIYIFRTAGLPDDDILTAPPTWTQTVQAEFLLPIAYLWLPSRQTMDAHRAHIKASQRMDGLSTWSCAFPTHPWSHIPADQTLDTSFKRWIIEMTIFADPLNMENQGRRFSLTKAQIRTHDTLLALAQYRARHGRSPHHLSDLMPSFLTHLPTGLEPTETLILENTPDGPVVYSRHDGRSLQPDPKTGQVYYPTGGRVIRPSPAIPPTSPTQTSASSPPDSPSTAHPQTSPSASHADALATPQTH